jgi:photosystem II stability/assembly factor-like uncharacterized protein
MCLKERFLSFIVIALFSLCSICTIFICPNLPVKASSQEPLRWNNVHIPGANEAGNQVLAAGSDVTHLALASDGTLYAAVQGLSNSLFRSTDGGLTWAAAGNVHDNIVDIAISPRDVKRIYYATSSSVYCSVNSGRTFSALPPNPGGAGTGHKAITSMDVTSLDGNNIIAVATRNTDNASFGGVYLLDESKAIPAWVDTSIGSYDVYAARFSPNYISDHQLVAVITNETDTFIANKVGDAGWNGVSERIKLNRDNSPTPAPVAVNGTACIAFSPGYYGDPASDNCTLFIGINTNSGLGDVYKINLAGVSPGSAATDLNIGQLYGYRNIDVAALTAASDGVSTLVIAGEASGSKTYASLDAGRNWTKTRKEPSGSNLTCLLAAPDFSKSGRIYAATSGTNSALSLSRDGGATWNQSSLIDTAIDSIIDVAPSPQYSRDNTIFMLTFGSGHSLWRSKNGGDNWERIFTYRAGVIDEMNLVSLSPRYGTDSATIFISGASTGKNAVWQSTDDGQSFRCRFALNPENGGSLGINAWAIIDDNSFFIASYDGSESKVYLTTNGGFLYGNGTPAGAQSVSSLVVSPFFKQDGTLLAGNSAGLVYISSDNNLSFHTLPTGSTPAPLAGEVTVAFDPHYDKNHVVYASGDNADTGIRRFNTATGQEWAKIDATLPSGSIIDCLAVTGDGTLYAANSKINQGIERCLTPSSGKSTPFESVTRYLPDGATLTGLRQSGPCLWSVDSTNVKLLSYYDTLTSPASPTAPANKVSGLGALSEHNIKNIVLNWSTLEGATTYEWQCDFSPGFLSATTALSGTTSGSSVRLPSLEPATTYTWRVRATAPVLSPWSAEQTFTTSLDTEAVILKTESPSAGANEVPLKPTFQWTAINGASAYELVVSTSENFEKPSITRIGTYAIPTNAWQCDVSLDYLTTYYWHIRAISQSTTGSWSATGIFTTTMPGMTETPLSAMLLQATTSLQNKAPAATPVPLQPTVFVPNDNPAPSPASFSFNQGINIPVWVVILIFSLIATIFLALFVILSIVSRIRRF